MRTLAPVIFLSLLAGKFNTIKPMLTRKTTLTKKFTQDQFRFFLIFALYSEFFYFTDNCICKSDSKIDDVWQKFIETLYLSNFLLPPYAPLSSIHWRRFITMIILKLVIQFCLSRQFKMVLDSLNIWLRLKCSSIVKFFAIPLTKSWTNVFLGKS